VEAVEKEIQRANRMQFGRRPSNIEEFPDITLVQPIKANGIIAIFGFGSDSLIVVKYVK
jgi:hypothetical protein